MMWDTLYIKQTNEQLTQLNIGLLIISLYMQDVVKKKGDAGFQSVWSFCFHNKVSDTATNKKQSIQEGDFFTFFI